jgi:alanine racemase
MSEAVRTRPSGLSCRSWVEVDLSNLEFNLVSLRNFVGVPVMAVVKADAYGHGASRVGVAAAKAGCPMLAVVSMEEAVLLQEALTDAGLDCRLLVLGTCDAYEYGLARELGIHVSAHGRESVESIVESTKRSGRDRAAAQPLMVHLKLDTGMHRLGAQVSQAESLVRSLLETESVELAGVWTHLAVADEPEDPFTLSQLACFEKAISSLQTAVGGWPRQKRPLLHAANSAAAIAFPSARYDIVRAGIAIYGVKPSANFTLPSEIELRPVLSWKSRVVLTKSVEPGARPSYGRTRAVESSQLAVVPVGYADGYLRALSNVGEVLIRGRRCRIAGVVTMDYLIVECAPDVRPGDEVVLIGRQKSEEITTEELAQKAGTIAYEVLCRIGPRVARTYLPGSRRD